MSLSLLLCRCLFCRSNDLPVDVFVAHATVLSLTRSTLDRSFVFFFAFALSRENTVDSVSIFLRFESSNYRGTSSRLEGEQSEHEGALLAAGTGRENEMAESTRSGFERNHKIGRTETFLCFARQIYLRTRRSRDSLPLRVRFSRSSRDGFVVTILLPDDGWCSFGTWTGQSRAELNVKRLTKTMMTATRMCCFLFFFFTTMTTNNTEPISYSFFILCRI